MNIKLKNNSLFTKLIWNIDFSLNPNFEVIEFINENILSPNICKIDIKEKDDFVVVKKEVKKEGWWDLNDLSWIEWSINEIYLKYTEPYFEPILVLGKRIFDFYCQYLAKNFSQKFLVCFSINDFEYKSITIRFYKVREQEKPILMDDLEKYELNWMMVGYINY